MLSLLLIRGIKESAFVNGLIVITKVAIVILFIVFGWGFINPANHTPYIPPNGTFVDCQGVSHHFGGLMGILGAGGVVFFAFIGFDAVSTAAQEAKNPKRDMPIGILGSLVICTVLYILFAHVLTGVATVEDFRTQGKRGLGRVRHLDLHARLRLAGEVRDRGDPGRVLVGDPGHAARSVARLLRDEPRRSGAGGVLRGAPAASARPTRRTSSSWSSSALFAGFVPGDIVGDMTSIGTLFAFILVCAGVWILRVRHPHAAAPVPDPAGAAGADPGHHRVRAR